MASREKRPLALSKSKQKINNNSGLSPADNKAKKSKIIITKRQIEWRVYSTAGAVVAANPLPPKLEANLPRKKTLESFKRKQQKLRAVKTKLIKAKQKVKSLKRIPPDTKRIVRTKKLRREKGRLEKEEEGGEEEEEDEEEQQQQQGEEEEEGARETEAILAQTTKETEGLEEEEEEEKDVEVAKVQQEKVEKDEKEEDVRNKKEVDEGEYETKDTNATKLPSALVDNSTENSGKSTDTGKNSAKNNIRTSGKKSKSLTVKAASEISEQQSKEDQSLRLGTTAKGTSPKSNKKAAGDNFSPRSVKSQKVLSQKNSNTARDREPVKYCESDPRALKGKRIICSSRDSEETRCSKSNNGTDATIIVKSNSDEKCSIDLTIDEVIASMLSDSDVDDCGSSSKDTQKLKRSKRMLVDERLLCANEMKQEMDTDETRGMSDENLITSDPGTPLSANITVVLKKKSPNSTVQRSLRNGKLRQLSDSGISIDLETSKKRRRLNSDDPTATPSTTSDQSSDVNMDTEYYFSEYSSNDNRMSANTNNGDSSVARNDCTVPSSRSTDGTSEIKRESESSSSSCNIATTNTAAATATATTTNNNNNNGDRLERVGDVGPMLRSKTKTRNVENEVKNEDVKSSALVKTETSEDCKKLSYDALRKERILARFSADKTKCRRNSLNIDMKKAVNSFHSMGKADSTVQIDRMIENIKLTIVKSIENKIFGTDKSLALGNNFEVPNVEEIVAPLSTETQKLCIEDSIDEEEVANVTNKEIKSENADNSVPKVADTAKEIEKLVMGDTESTDTHNSEETGEKCNRSDHPITPMATVQRKNDVEDDDSNSNNGDAAGQVSIDGEVPSASNSTTAPTLEADVATRPTTITAEAAAGDKSSDDVKKCTSVRKSSRTTGKSASDPTNSNNELDTTKRIGKSKNYPKSNEKRETLPLTDSGKRQCAKQDDAFLQDGCPVQDTILQNADLESSAGTLESTEMEEEKSSVSHLQDEKSNNGEENDDSSPPGDGEEMETLESISLEVERLVAETAGTGTNETMHIHPDAKLHIDDCEKVADERVVVEWMISENDDTASNQKDLTTAVMMTTSVAGNSSTSVECNLLALEQQQQTNAGSENNPAYSLKSESSPTMNCKSKSQQEVEVANDRDLHSEYTTEYVDTKVTGNVEANCPRARPQSANADVIEKAMIRRHDKETGVEEKDEYKTISSEENKRVLRTRDRQKKMDTRQQSSSVERLDLKMEEAGGQTFAENNIARRDSSGSRDVSRGPEASDSFEDSGHLELPQIRTRRCREAKKRKEDPLVQNSSKARRNKKETKRMEQQNKEETLLDNEVAKINENKAVNDEYEKNSQSIKYRGFSEPSADSTQRSRVGKSITKDANNRCKSENDIETVQQEERCRERLSHVDSLIDDDNESKQPENNVTSIGDCKSTKSLEMLQKDSDETSTSGESSSSVNSTIKIFETPEDLVMKESILGMLGLTPLEKVGEHLGQKKKDQYTGTLKTVIRVQKDKMVDKKRSRSPLKMVLKQGRVEGDGDSLEFYTIQKEFGTTGLGDSSSGANRKITTNHRYSCDEDNEETPSKDRQSLVIPEKSSSFSIHPGRLCADVCCYCFGKFGSLDTPMHLAQMKSDDRMKKILNIETHLTKDSCLCDACYRHVDRKAHVSPTNVQSKPQKQHRQLMVSKCCAKDCKETAKHNVKRRWLVKIKLCLQNQVNIDWDSSQHSSMSFCSSHYPKIEKFLTCALCKRRLAKNQTHLLPVAETNELNIRLAQHRIPVPLIPGTFVCKLCRYFTQLQLKFKDLENMTSSGRNFFKNYRMRILHYRNIEDPLNEEEDQAPKDGEKEKDKEKDKDNKDIKENKEKIEKGTQKKSKCVSNKSSNKSSESMLINNSASEKSTPESYKVEGINMEAVSVSRVPKMSSVSVNEDDNASTPNVQYLSIESTIEKLKKRKTLDSQSYGSTSCAGQNVNDVVEILAMDKEVTLTRLPKRPRTNNDAISPVVQRLGANPSISVRTLFPGEEDMNLHANIEFGNVREVTPQGWEKCSTMIQYDRETKLLWQELQRPYGNQSSFLRHLILLEKYYRSGDLVLAPNASRNAINYSTSVQNRLISFEGPEKMDEPIMEPISEYNNPQRLSGGYVQERDRANLNSSVSLLGKANVSKVLKLNPGVSLIKKPPPNLQRLSVLPSTSSYTQNNGGMKRKDAKQSASSYSGGKVFQLSEPDFKRLQTLKKQKQMLAERQTTNTTGNSGSSSSATNTKPTTTQYQKAQQISQTQFQKHLRMQQEMLNRQSRGDFEPLICDTRALANENNPTQNLLNNLNLPKSIQVTAKPPVPLSIPIMPKIPKSLTVIPQTVTKPTDK